MFCVALKFNKESPTTCCNNGKVLGPDDNSTMKPFPKPTTKINALWHELNLMVMKVDFTF